jgi:hypothetical protein
MKRFLSEIPSSLPTCFSDVSTQIIKPDCVSFELFIKMSPSLWLVVVMQFVHGYILLLLRDNRVQIGEYLQTIFIKASLSF